MSCLFNSLSYFIPNMSQTDLRQQITNYLLGNPRLFYEVDARTVIQWESNTSLEGYVENMRRSHVWGGATEIKAFCEMFNKSVIINLMNGTKIEFLPDCPNEKTNVINVSYTGSHYEPVR